MDHNGLVPPRSHKQIAADPTRRDLLRGLNVTEQELAELRGMPEAEALAKIDAWRQAAAAWSHRRRAFLEAALRGSHRSPAP
jgi:ABC-type uncharacterized transport system ATPase subunit